jgi:hypothetical protein
MKKTMLALLATAAALSPAAPAYADEGDASLRTIYEAGRCIVDNDRRTAISFLQSLPIDEGEADLTLLPDNLTRRCAQGLGTVDSLHVRGAMAQALFFRDFGGFGIEPGRSVPLVNLNIPAQSSPPGTGMTELYRWADCVVRNDIGHAERLLQSRVGSQAESAAIGELQPYMRACAGEQSLAVRPSDFRSLVAQSAYNSMYRYWTRQLDPVRDQ